MATRTKKTNGSILRSFRKANGYSIPQFSKMVNLGPATISRYERDVFVMPQVVVDVLNSSYNVGLKNTNKKATKNLRIASVESSTKTSKARKSTKVKATTVSTVLDRLEALRSSQSMSMVQFGSKYGFSNGSVFQIKSGSLKYVPISAMINMVKAGIDLNELFK